MDQPRPSYTISELLEVALAMRDWIDSVPSDTQLPAMPGFDRDWADEVIDSFTNKVVWRERMKELPEGGRKVLTHSLSLPEDCAYRLMDGQFVRNCTEVKYWAYADELTTL